MNSDIGDILQEHALVRRDGQRIEFDNPETAGCKMRSSMHLHALGASLPQAIVTLFRFGQFPVQFGSC